MTNLSSGVSEPHGEKRVSLFRMLLPKAQKQTQSQAFQERQNRYCNNCPNEDHSLTYSIKSTRRI